MMARYKCTLKIPTKKIIIKRLKYKMYRKENKNSTINCNERDDKKSGRRRQKQIGVFVSKHCCPCLSG